MGLVLQIWCCDKVMQLIDDYGSHSMLPAVKVAAHGVLGIMPPFLCINAYVHTVPMQGREQGLLS